MMTTYSLDLRQRVMAAYEQTQHKSNVCKTFSIARTTLDAWITLEAQTGELNARVYRTRGYNIRLFYLPAYSPQLNPVEKCWSVLKAKLRQLRSKGSDWNECFDKAFFQM